MARPLRLTYPEALYHVTARGNARHAISADAQDRQTFLAVLQEVVARYHWLCHTYCLSDEQPLPSADRDSAGESPQLGCAR